jgi:hypothetical protein
MSPTNLNILFAVLSVALYIGYIDPMTSSGPGYVWTPERSISQLKTSNIEYGGALAQLDLIEKEIAKVDTSYRTINPEDKKKIGIMLADSVDQVKVRNEIVSMAAKKGIALTSLNVEEDKNFSSSQYGSYKVSFGMKVRYPTFKQFMENYEKSMRFFVLDGLTIARQDNAEDSSVKIEDEEALIIAVTSRVYYLK